MESPSSYHSPSVPTTSHDVEELRCGTGIHNPCILPDNIYGDRAPIDIEHNIQIRPTNEDDDLGMMHSASSRNRIDYTIFHRSSICWHDRSG